MEITKKLTTNDEQIEGLELHSVVNILSVISSQLQLIQMECNFEEILKPAINRTMDFVKACKTKDKSVFNIASFKKFEDEVFDSLKNLQKKQKILDDGSEVEEYTQIFKNIFTVFEVRLKEIVQRWENPDAWISFKADSFIDDFKEFFYAMEKNSKGRYKIIYNIADQDEKDYLVNFAINSDQDNKLHLPLILKDVIRDLIANARKYTSPGGKITVGISQKNRLFRFVVEDSGYGIPESEINKVVDYGYRGSNVKDSVRTMGGGFGLTKAYHVIKNLNGRMWIDSDEGNGTKITLEIPIPSHY